MCGHADADADTDGLVHATIDAVSATAPFPPSPARNAAASPATTEPQPPELQALGFVVLSTLGEGAFSKVKLASHTLLGKSVAVKMIQKCGFSKQGVSVRQVLREILLLAALDHDNINRLLHVVDSPSHIHVVLEYEPRGELFDHVLKQGKLSETDARPLFKQIVAAVQYCHSQGVVHRDLKLENVLLAKDGSVKICDFGFANLLVDNSAGFESFCGSPPYAAPEMIARKKYQGPEVDAWSLGVILYCMVTGMMPFGHKATSKMFVAIMSGKYDMPQKISKECQSLIAAILVVKPAERATLEQIRVHPWMTADGLAPGEAPPADPTSARRPLRQDVLDKIASLDFTQDAIDSFARTGEPGAVRTAYYLLLADAPPLPLPEVPRQPSASVAYVGQASKSDTAGTSLLASIRAEHAALPDSPNPLPRIQGEPRSMVAFEVRVPAAQAVQALARNMVAIPDLETDAGLVATPPVLYERVVWRPQRETQQDDQTMDSFLSAGSADEAFEMLVDSVTFQDQTEVVVFKIIMHTSPHDTPEPSTLCFEMYPGSEASLRRLEQIAKQMMQGIL
ncbi:hypothetical protein HK105_208101 [Polyrhizophydium stewartii]|uniref:Protein kinase domain-containing protein n=1 Tax=Polyrhizophydium stewartii TaxID=2732419 RepID=A0ABR4MYP4_9FUNG